MAEQPRTEHTTASQLRAVWARIEHPLGEGAPRWARRLVWVRWVVPLVVLVVVLVAGSWSWASEYPVDVGRDIGSGIDTVLDWIKDNLEPLWNVIDEVITRLLVWVEDILFRIPWPAFIVGVAILSWRTAGLGMALFAGASLALLATFGLWESTMETVALVIITVALSILIAVPLGTWASQSDRLDRLLRPILDGMQTMPSFVYLVPFMSIFGLGAPAAVLATLIYAVPPAVRLTNLGIRQVPSETLEAAESFGATPAEMLLKVKVPLATPTIMAGVNQTTLMALAMVVIASLVGAGGLGLDVLRALGRIEPGNALLAGLGIVFLAIIIDRITQAFAGQQSSRGTGVG